MSRAYLPRDPLPGGIDMVLYHGMQLCRRPSKNTWQTVWLSTGSGRLWPLWLSGPLGDDTRYFAHDMSTQGFGSSGLRPAEIAGNLSNFLDIGIGNFQGAYRTRLSGLPADTLCLYHM